MYLDKFEKFGIKQFLNDIFKGTSPNAYMFHSQATQPKDFLATCSQLDKLFEEEINTNEQKNNEGFIGFQTGKGQKIHIDSKKVEKALNFFDEKDLAIEDEGFFFEKDKIKENTTNTELFMGFKTANGGKIAIDDKCLKKAENIFDFDNEKENIVMKKQNDGSEFSAIKKTLLKNRDKEKQEKRVLMPSLKNTSLENEKTNAFSFEAFDGFQTAKGNQIIIDNAKIKAAEKMFLDSDNKNKNNEKTSFEDKRETKKINTEDLIKKNDGNHLVIQNNNKKTNDINHQNNDHKKKNVHNSKESSFIKGKFIKSTEKPLFLDFKNKKFKPSKEKDSHEKNKNISASTTSFMIVSKNQINLVKSTEKFSLINPLSKKILSEKSERLYSNFLNHEHFVRKGVSTKKGIKRDFSNFKNSCLPEKTVEFRLNFNHNLTIKTNDENSSKNKKEPNQIFNLQTKYLKAALDENAIKLKLKDLSIIPDENANNSFEINETSALNHSFICECVNFSQNSCEKCLCNGKLIITAEYFQKHLQEKFPKINISEKWVKHHFRFIVWKLSSYSKHIQPLPINKQLNIENVITELEKRLLAEQNGKRSVLKKIIEKDEVMSKHMVLLVGKIFYVSEQKFHVVELSDGWYSIFTVIFNNAKENIKNLFYLNNNALLLDLIVSKKLFSGLKIHVIGIEKTPYQNLANFFDLDFCENEKILVNLNYNNISRAHWQEKLGLKKQRFLLKNLNSLRPSGGFVSMIDVFVLKKYPLLEKKNNKLTYFNNLSKRSDAIPNNKNIYFKISVLDSLVFESKNKIEQKNFVEIGFTNACTEFYDIIKEGDRIKITNLKANDYDRILKRRFDFVNNEIIERKIYLELTKYSKIILFNDLKRNSFEKKNVNNFGKEICRKMRRSISNISSNEEILNKFKKEKQENKKLNNELDCLIYILSMDLKNKQFIYGKDYNNNDIRIQIHEKEFFSGKIVESLKEKIVLFLNVALDSIESNYLAEQKIRKKIILLLTNENTKIVSNNLKNMEIYQEEYDKLNDIYFNKFPMSQVDLDQIIKEIEEVDK